MAAPDSSVDIPNLTFHFPLSATAAIDSLSLTLPLSEPSRVLLIGSNGSGKSTLLKIIAGKKLSPSPVYVRGRDVFRSCNTPGLTYVGLEWSASQASRGDISVSALLASLSGHKFRERRDALLRLLDVGSEWRLNALSDGQRRRVQLVFSLMPLWSVLLLDEVTVDLDVLVRHNLIQFLKQESIERNATIIYATHSSSHSCPNFLPLFGLSNNAVFDGLNDFPTHLLHMNEGRASPLEPYVATPGQDLHGRVLQMLRDDYTGKGEKVQDQREKSEAAMKERNAEAFYKQFDYSH